MVSCTPLRMGLIQFLSELVYSLKEKHVPLQWGAHPPSRWVMKRFSEPWNPKANHENKPCLAINWMMFPNLYNGKWLEITKTSNFELVGSGVPECSRYMSPSSIPWKEINCRNPFFILLPPCWITKNTGCLHRQQSIDQTSTIPPWL